jgi:hypothetical protein
MRHLSWAEFDHAVETIAGSCRGSAFNGSDGFCLAGAQPVGVQRWE